VTFDAAGAPPQFDELLDGSGLRVAVVAARFNGDITQQMVDGAMAGLAEHGVDAGDVKLVWVPGAFELPLSAQALAETQRFDAVICLGAVIRGDTAHFDYVAGHACHGIGRVSLDAHLPVVFGVLTTDTVEQAVERAALDRGNKGYEVAQGAIAMARLLERIAKGDI
jgi:6,7-dimethyl-8-ribityllumazine synthase